MAQELNVALVGLDTSHTVEFARRLMAPDCKPELKVEGMRVTGCLRFPSLFQSEPDQDKRQAQLEAWGVPVTTDWDRAIAGSDAVMLTINDPALHLEYVTRAVDLGKPLFIDKPLAATFEQGHKICRLVKEHKVLAFTASGMRFVPQIKKACSDMPQPRYTHVFGALGGGPAGYKPAQTLVWYGVHSCELLQTAMGRGAVTVRTLVDSAGAVMVVEYPDRRRGVVEMTNQVWLYGGTLRDGERCASFVIEVPYMVHNMPTVELEVIGRFFRGGPVPVDWEDALEVMNLLDAARRSAESGKTEALVRVD